MAKCQSGKNMALLVGCNYPNLLKKDQLKGCHNDVNAVRATLISVYGFDPNNIEVLMDKPGTKPTAMPTGANIKSALERLISQLREGDVLFFHFSGHGSKIPLEEAILACDLNPITKMDIRKLVDGVPKGATFVFFSDSCHSGGLIDKEKEQIGPNTQNWFPNVTIQLDDCRPRFMPFETLLERLLESLSLPTSLNNVAHNIETIMLQTFGSDASLLFRQTGRESPRALKPDQGILLSACQSNEVAKEYNNNNEYFGAFTHAVQVIIREKLLSHPFSNKQLVMKARDIIHKRLYKLFQHPCLYCSDENVNQNFLPNANYK